MENNTIEIGQQLIWELTDIHQKGSSLDQTNNLWKIASQSVSKCYGRTAHKPTQNLFYEDHEKKLWLYFVAFCMLQTNARR